MGREYKQYAYKSYIWLLENEKINFIINVITHKRHAIKAAMEYQFFSLRLAKMKNFENIVGKIMWKQAFHSYTVDGSV